MKEIAFFSLAAGIWRKTWTCPRPRLLRGVYAVVGASESGNDLVARASGSDNGAQALIDTTAVYVCIATPQAADVLSARLLSSTADV